MDSNPHRKPYDETVAKYWRDWYNSKSAEEKKEFNQRRYQRQKELKAARAAKVEASVPSFLDVSNDVKDVS